MFTVKRYFFLVFFLSFLGSQIMGLQAALGFSSSLSSHESKKSLDDKNDFSSFTGEVKGSRIRVRTAPKLDSEIIQEVFQGELLAVVGEIDNFYIIKPMAAMKGFVFRTFILENKIEGELVNVRSQPNTNSPILTRLSSGTELRNAIPSKNNDKWLEIELPSDLRFYISKEFVTKKGSIDFFNYIEKQKALALDSLETAIAYAEKELEKALEDINLNLIYQKISCFQSKEYEEIPGFFKYVEEALSKIQNRYLSKKDEYENKKLNIEEQKISSEAKDTPALSSYLKKNKKISNKKAYNKDAIENSLYQLWLSVQEKDSDLEVELTNLTLDDFYTEEKKKAINLKGTVKIYSQFTKNPPGDFILVDDENKTLAFLYSTKMDLNSFVDKKVSILGVSRPNNYFAFPAYFVLSSTAVIEN